MDKFGLKGRFKDHGGYSSVVKKQKSASTKFFLMADVIFKALYQFYLVYFIPYRLVSVYFAETYILLQIESPSQSNI